MLFKQFVECEKNTLKDAFEHNYLIYIYMHVGVIVKRKKNKHLRFEFRKCAFQS